MGDIKQLKPRGRSELTKKCWAVVAAHYVNFDLTHAEALAEAEDLRRRNQPGVSVITNEAARRLLQDEIQESKAKAA